MPTHRPTSLQAALAVLRAELTALRDLLDEDEYAMLTEILEIWLRRERPEERAGSLLIVAVEGAVDRFCGRPRAAKWRRSSVCSSRRKKPLARCSRDELREAIEEQRRSLAFAVQRAEQCHLQLETLEALDASFDAPTLRVVEGGAA